MNPGQTRLRYRLKGIYRRGYRCVELVAGSKRPGLRILSFHEVAPLDIAAFGRLLEYVLKVHGVVAPEEAERYLSEPGSRDTRRGAPCLLTFDDGLRSNFNVAQEVLSRYDVKGLFFVCPGLMDVPLAQQQQVVSSQLFPHPDPTGYSIADPTLMSWNDLEQICKMGHVIGSHTMRHKCLSLLNHEEMQQEIAGSSQMLSSRLGIPVRWFAFPFGDVASLNERSVKVISQNYRFCCTGVRGINTPGVHPLGLLREPVDFRPSFDYQQLTVDGGLDIFYWRERRHLRAMIQKALQPK
jgi:peptidoglycan/xylan/chitin deacetylase (PgdA/CDA1 family)